MEIQFTPTLGVRYQTDLNIQFQDALGTNTALEPVRVEGEGRAFWTWVSGNSVGLATPVHGTRNVTAPSNRPGARIAPSGGADSSGNIWVFGGGGPGSSGFGYNNDLWKFNGANWTWVAGNNASDQNGNYNVLNVGTSSTTPGARQSHCMASDNSGHLWVFGGEGLDSAGTASVLNDLWEFDGSQWVWRSGSNFVDQVAAFAGARGVANAGNRPGARSGAQCAVDNLGNFWLFGGYGYDTSSQVYLADLWRFSAGTWTWFGGASEPTSYGTLGVDVPSNYPPGRKEGAMIRWGSGLWLFGGDDLNDLWRYQSGRWTWMSGTSNPSDPGSFGSLNVAYPSNVPPGKRKHALMVDASNNIYLFGSGNDTNDLWRFDGSQWTWLSGNNVSASTGAWGTQGNGDFVTTPSGRESVASSTSADGQIWVYGGYGRDSSGTVRYLNDLWRFSP